MSIRTTVTLEEDVLARVKRESRARGASFKDTINDLLRTALLNVDKKPKKRMFPMNPTHMGQKPGLNYDSVEALIEYAEGPWHR
jgi:hypothetical protein